MYPTGDVLSRRQFLEELGISDSSERRKRKKGGHTWPPHLFIGRKVYYRRSAVDDWLRRQEAICRPTDDVEVEAMHRRAEVAGNG
jgi:predicted DNA-binding transcriptional regulator AlpA